MFFKNEDYPKSIFSRSFATGLIVLFTLLIAIAGCGEEQTADIDEEAGDAEEVSNVEEEEAQKEPVTVRLAAANGGYPQPFMHYPRMRGTVMKYIFDSLLEPDENGCIPWLAKEWEICEEGITHTIDLQEGVLWHDGEQMTAGDVVFSFEYFRRNPPVFIGEVITDPDYIQSIEATSDYRVEIVTAEPNSTFKCEAGMLRIIPEHIWADVEDPYDFTEPEAFIGCGPFVFEDYNREHNTYRYSAFENYWGPEQRVSAIEYVPVGDDILAIENGDISISRIPPDLVDRFESDPEFFLEESPAFAGYMISFNMHENELFATKEFRQALTYAINKDDLVEKAARGAAKPGSPGILPLDHHYYNPDLPEYGHNPERAREMLAELGMEEGKTLELIVGEGQDVRIGEILKEQFAAVGIELIIESVDRGTRDSRANEGKYQAVLLHMGAWGLDPDYLRIRYHGGLAEEIGGSATAVLGRNQGFEHPEVDRLTEVQLRETDPEERIKALYELQEVLAEEVPEIPLINIKYYYTYRPDQYDGWTFMFDHAVMEHAKLSYLER